MSACSQALQGRVALVTGGSRNIGRHIALQLAAAGAWIMITGHRDEAAAQNVVAEIKTAGGQAAYRLGDVGDETCVQSWVVDTVADFGRLDILINNAATRRNAAFETMSYAQWREIINVILDGAFLCARTAVPHMLAQGGGCIVNLGGLSGHVGAHNRAHVVAAKSGIVGLTRALAVEFAERGIRVNCVVPGLIDTVRGEAAGEQPSLHGGHAALLGRAGKPEHVAALVRHLCLPESDYITGQVVHVSGGAYLAGA